MSDKDELLKLQNLLENLLAQDVKLRLQYEVENKFRFVKDKLQSFLDAIHAEMTAAVAVNAPTEISSNTPTETYAEVYIYLYNAQGLTVASWRNMLTRKLLYEYSINRPIYANKHHIESLIKSKTNREQHGYLAIKVLTQNVISQESPTKDALQNDIIKVREGAFRFENILAFTHNDIHYSVLNEGDLKRLTV